MNATRHGILPDRADLRLCALMLVVALVDFSQVSWWSGTVKPAGDLQRWLTVCLQAGYLAANAGRLPRAVAAQAPLFALTAFCAASALWSVSPVTSLLGGIRLFLLGASVVVAQQRHGPATVARIFLVAVAVLLLANLLSLAVPRVSIMTGTLAGAFRGLTDHKNTLGQFCGLTLAFLLAAHPRSPREVRARAALLALLLLTVWLTRSATASVLCATALGLFAAVRLLQITRLPALVGTVAASLIALAAATSLAGALDPFATLGRDPTLTGRAEIWAFVELYVRQRPWLGYGYRAFPLSDLLRIDPRWGLDSYVVGSTHNAYLAIVTEIGLAGLAGFLTWLALLAARNFPRSGRETQIRAATVLGVFLVSGLTESFAGLSPGLYFAALLVAFPPPAVPLRASRTAMASVNEV